jgi:hypothetical protein
MTVEPNRPAVTDRFRPHADDAAAEHAAPHRGLTIRRLDLKFHGRSGEQSAIGFYQCAPGRQIDERHVMPRPNPGSHDAVFVGAAAARHPALGMRSAHSGVHCLVR